MRSSRVFIPAVALVAALALSSCAAPAATEVETEETTKPTPTPEAVVWDGCPEGSVDAVAAQFVASGSTDVVVEGALADVTNPVLSPLIPATACVINFLYGGDAANAGTIVIAPDDDQLLSDRINEAALAAGYTVEDYGFLQYRYTVSPGEILGFYVSTAASAAELSDPFGDFEGGIAFPGYDGALVLVG